MKLIKKHRILFYWSSGVENAKGNGTKQILYGLGLYQWYLNRYIVANKNELLTKDFLDSKWNKIQRMDNLIAYGTKLYGQSEESA